MSPGRLTNCPPDKEPLLAIVCRGHLLARYESSKAWPFPTSASATTSEAVDMSETIQKYKLHVMPGFLASIAVVNSGRAGLDVVVATRTQPEKLVHCSSYVCHVKPAANVAETIAKIAPQGLKCAGLRQ